MFFSSARVGKHLYSEKVIDLRALFHFSSLDQVLLFDM